MQDFFRTQAFWQGISTYTIVQIIGVEYLAISSSSGRFVGGKLGPAFFMPLTEGSLQILAQFLNDFQ